MVARSFLINNIVNISLLIRLIRTLKRQKMDGYDGRSTICRKISVACQHIPYLHELFYAERREFLFTFTNGNTYAVYTLPERWNVNYLHFPSPSVIFCFHVHGAKETFVWLVNPYLSTQIYCPSRDWKSLKQTWLPKGGFLPIFAWSLVL